MAQHGHHKQWLVTLGVTLWVSFLCAGGATILFFAAFDPVEIAEVATFPMELDRTSGYSAGFLLFWVLLIANSCLVNWLLVRDLNSNKGSNKSSNKSSTTKAK